MKFRRPTRGLSIQDKVAVVIAGLIAVAVSALVLESAGRMGEMADAAFGRGEAALLNLLADQLAPALDFRLPDEAEATLDSALENPDIVYAAVCDEDGEMFAQLPKHGELREGFSACGARHGDGVGPMRLAVREIRNPTGERVGAVVLGITPHFRESLLAEHYRTGLLVGIAVLAMSLLASALLGRLLTRPVLALTEAAQEVAATSELTRRVETTSRDEIGMLTRSFNEMLSRLSDATVSREAAEGASEAKSHFLANMSHEIRTPMNAVLGLTQLCLQEDLSWRQRDYLTKIHTAGRSLLGIIDDILDLSKIEAGHMELEQAAFVLDEVLEGLADLMALKAQGKGLELLFYVSPEVPHCLVGDPLRVSQILMNLVSNAIKYTDTGEVVLAIAAPVRKGAELQLAISVRDTGIGIAPEQMERLFESFQQADGSTTRRYGGTGLGLTICRELVELMGGEIHVESQPGVGSTFSLTIMVQEGSQALPAPCEERQASIEGVRVLLVDDHPVVREILAAQLRAFGMRVTGVASGEEAIASVSSAAADDRFEVVLMDWKMPGMDGLEAARRIRELELPGPAPRLVMVTAHGRQDVLARAEQIGLDAFMVKPASPAVLRRTIATVLGSDSEAGEIIVSALHPQPRVAAHLHAVRVLLVEDNALNQQVAYEMLVRQGMHVEVAENGAQALEMASHELYDVVLMDIQMPVMDGLEATRRIRALAEGPNGDERFRSLPILAMTAHALVGDRKKSLAAGMNDHVTKPIRSDDLFSKLAAWVPAAGELGDMEEKVATGSGQDAPWLSLLTGFDTGEALERMGQRPELLLELLLRFRAEYGREPEEIREALARGEPEVARRIAHTLKSVAGNLGAGGLASAAAVVEQGVVRREETVDESIESLAGELSAVMAVLRSIPAPAEEREETEEDLEGLLEELLEAVRSRRPKACAGVVKRLAVAYRPPALVGGIHDVLEDVRRFRYREAEVRIREVLGDVRGEDRG